MEEIITFHPKEVSIQIAEKEEEKHVIPAT